MQFKILIKNLNLLNVLLLSAVVFFTLYNIFPSFSTQVRYAIPVSKKIIDEEDEQTAEIRIPSIAEYANISEDNLFHPERKIPVEKKEEQPLPKPDFVLYGTLITDDIRIAYLEDLKAPRNTPGRGKRQTAMRKGDALSGFTLKEIETDKVIMQRGEEKIVIPVSDPSRQREQHEPVVTTTTPKQPQPRKPGIPPQKAPNIQNPAKSRTMNNPQLPSQQRGGFNQSRAGRPYSGVSLNR